MSAGLEPMTRRLPQLAALVALLAAATVSTPASAGPPQAGRFAAPNGSGTACTTAAPCKLVTAINEAPQDSTVVIEPGTYGSASKPITVNLSDTHALGSLDITGLAGSPSPVIHSSAATGFDLEGDSNLSHVDLIHSGDSIGVYDVGGSVDHVVVHSSDAAYGACNIYTRITDSVCANSGYSEPAIEIDGGSNYSPVLQGVTAEATGTGGTGFFVWQTFTGTIDATVSNSIIRGAGTDLQLKAASGGSSVLTITASDYLTTIKIGPGSNTVDADPTDIDAAPKFVNAAAGNFNEKAGSPTINKGLADIGTDTDVLGNPRTLGSAPDMGAYEFLQKPTATTLKVGKSTKHVAHLTVKVNPEGLATKVKLVATLGHHHKTSHTVSAGRGRTAKTVHLALHGLKAGSKYRVHAVATNTAGHADSATKKVKTKK